jgi:homoserine kinase type II
VLLDQPPRALGRVINHASNVPQPRRLLYGPVVGVFTRLTETDVAEIADQFALGKVESFEAIVAGTINSNVSVVTDRGRWVVRINEGKFEADVAWEARLVAALAKGGLPVPVPVDSDGLPFGYIAGAPNKQISVFPWSKGRHLAPAEVTPAHAREIGAALAKLHLIGLELPASWQRHSIYDHDHLVARFANVARSKDPALARAIEVLRDELALAERDAELRRAATTGIIHGDLFRDNVLWEGEKIVAILDFEQASGGSLAYDLAVCINDWCWTDKLQLGIVEPLLAGYEGVRKLPDGDRAALPIEVRASAARFTITRITDVYLARVDNPDKDFRAFLARCDAWRGEALGQLRALL